jgi:hypothetical protein
MGHGKLRRLVVFVTIAVMAATVDVFAQTTPPTVKIPEPGVPQKMTIQGRFIRAAYNNEAYAIVGYRLANTAIGEPWIVLDFGTTVREGVPNYTLTRSAISLDTPDGKTIPLPSITEFQSANLVALAARANRIRDSINYFPPSARRACRIGFFAEMTDRAMAHDQVELSSDRACLGRLYFPIDGGIRYGQHWLNVKFPNSVVRVPFRILTPEEEKMLDKNYKSIEKQVKEAFAPKKP